MNKKLNTLFFIIGGVVLNIIIFFLFLMLFLFIATLFPASSQGVVVIVGFLLAIFASFFAYTKIVQFFMTKVDMEKYFHPIFKPRHRRDLRD